jgi:hypothetical protein
MGQKDLPDAEAAALKEELRRAVETWQATRNVKRGGLRAVGVLLGFPIETAQAQVSAALDKRVGAGMADRIYGKLLGVSKEVFLRERGLTTPSPFERVTRLAALLGLPASAAVRVCEEAAFSGEASDEEIAERLRAVGASTKIAPSIELSDDLGSVMPKRQKKR